MADNGKRLRIYEALELRSEIRTLEHKRHKLNASIQAANFNNALSVDGEKLTLAEALELRKASNVRIGELSNQLTRSAFVRVTHKEDRDIEEAPDVAYPDARHEFSANAPVTRRSPVFRDRKTRSMIGDFKSSYGVV